MVTKVKHRVGSKAWFQANWKLIVIFLLMLFGLNKCTQSCNRQIIVDKQIKEIHYKDSIIGALRGDSIMLSHEIDLLKERVNTAKANTEVAKTQADLAKANEATAKADANAARATAKAEKLKRELDNTQK